MTIPTNLTDLETLFNSPWFIVVMLWSMFWKGLALWHAAGRRQKIWFVVLMIVNTLGILEIIYLLFVAKAIVEVKVVGEKEPKK